MKTLLYALCLPLLASCGLFTSIPPKVLEGQRGVYQGLSLIEENISMILQTYEEDCKAAVVYHLNFVYEGRIQEVRLSSATDTEKTNKIASLEAERDSEIQSTMPKIEERRKGMQEKAMHNIMASKKLSEAIYSYFSATPITIDNVDFWIEKMVTVAYNGRK